MTQAAPITANRTAKARIVTWRTLRQLDQFTVRELASMVKGAANYDTIRRYVNDLAAGGYLEMVKVPKHKGDAAIYRLKKNYGLQPPIPQPDGSIVDPNCQGVTPSHQQRLWTAMRLLKSFDAPALRLIAETTPTLTESVLQHLEATGYLQRTGRGNDNGKPGSHIQFRLAHNTGPLAPVLLKNGSVFDQNTLETVPKVSNPEKEVMPDKD